MEITFKDFVSVCPSAESPSPEVFAAVEPMFQSRLFLIKGIVTNKIYSMLDDIENDLQNPDYDRLCQLRRAVVGYVCASAYYLAIPHLDLVLTPTGFGVVSNQNVAPASSERVASLRKQVHDQELIYMDEIIDLLRPVVNWSVSTHGRFFFATLFWRASHLRPLGLPNPTRDDLSGYGPEIEAAALSLSRTLSPELYRGLIKAESTASASPMQQSLIIMWRAATAAWVKHDGSWRGHLDAMLRFVESNIDEFPEYRDSQTYQANHFKRYENKKDDSCFFFG